jgi:hypothetical protein
MQGALTYTPYFWASYVSRLEPVQAETQGMEGIHISLLSHKLALKTKNKNNFHTQAIMLLTCVNNSKLFKPNVSNKVSPSSAYSMK